MAITASEKRVRFDKCTQVCYIARMARNVKISNLETRKIILFWAVKNEGAYQFVQ